MKNSNLRDVNQMVLSVPEMASSLGISTNTAYDLAHSADFPAFRVGKRLLISKEGLDAWIQSQTKNPVA